MRSRDVEGLLETWHGFEARHATSARLVRRPARATWHVLKRWRSSGPVEALGSTLPGRERPPARGTILLIDDMVPEFDRNAGAVFMLGKMRLLTGAGFKVVFLPDNRSPTQPYTSALQAMGVEVLFGHFDVGRWLASRDGAVDYALVARPHVAPRYIPAIRAGTRARLLYYTHDLHFLRERRRFETTGDEWHMRASELLLRQETEIFRAVDCVTTPSAEEVPIIQGLAPGQDVRVMTPWVGREDAGAVPVESEVPLEERTVVLFVGGFQHLPNVDAAVFLATSVMPLVWERVPQAQLWIVGSKPPPEVVELHGGRVGVLGYVPDLWPYYRRARISVSPVRFGSGVKGKILSSMEAGVPVVTTTIGDEGIGLAPGVEGLIADDAEGLAAHVVRLFEDPALLLELGERGQRAFAHRFGRDRALNDLLAALAINS